MRHLLMLLALMFVACAGGKSKCATLSRAPKWLVLEVGEDAANSSATYQCGSCQYANSNGTDYSYCGGAQK